MRRHLLRSRAGQALVEYAVILALIGVGLMAVLVVLRNGVGAAYEETGARLDDVACGMERDAVCPSPGEPGDPGGETGSVGHGGGNGQGNHGNGNGNGGGDGSNGDGNGNNGNNGNGGGNGSNGRGDRPAR